MLPWSCTRDIGNLVGLKWDQRSVNGGLSPLCNPEWALAPGQVLAARRWATSITLGLCCPRWEVFLFERTRPIFSYIKITRDIGYLVGLKWDQRSVNGDLSPLCNPDWALAPGQVLAARRWATRSSSPYNLRHINNNGDEIACWPVLQKSEKTRRQAANIRSHHLPADGRGISAEPSAGRQLRLGRCLSHAQAPLGRTCWKKISYFMARKS
jgi:hypothetical protein